MNSIKLFFPIPIGGALFGFFLIPETRGKSADELSHFYRRRALAINPVDIISTTISLPGSRKSSELGTQPVGITGISLAWAGTGKSNLLLKNSPLDGVHFKGRLNLYSSTASGALYKVCCLGEKQNQSKIFTQSDTYLEAKFLTKQV